MPPLRKTPRAFFLLLFALLLTPGLLAAKSMLPPEEDPECYNDIDETFFFVTQQYRDFLHRDPTSSELISGAGPINSCLFRGDLVCADRERVRLSRSFWDHPEFRQQSMTFGLGLADYYPQIYDHGDFIALSYVVYLQRWYSDPPDHDNSGFNFWLGVVNNCTAPFVTAGQPDLPVDRHVTQCYNDIVKAFLVSTEYRSRFGCP